MTKNNAFNTEFYFNKLMECKSDSGRYSWLKETLKHFKIEFEEQNFEKNFNNIICKGSSKVWLSAHYDTIDINHCANDNSASLINLIHLKIKMPEVNIVLLDAEEPPYMGLGSANFSRYLKENGIAHKYIINLELTGYGNCICIGTRGGESKMLLESKFDNYSDFYFSEVETPFSDTDIFLKHGLDSILLMLLPIKGNKLLTERMYNCHTDRDTVDKMNFRDMDKLVNTLTLVLSDDVE